MARRTGKSKSNKERPTLTRRLLRWAVRMALLGILVGAITLAIGYWYFSQGLPNFERVTDFRPPQVSRILAADGTVVAEFFRERRTVIPREQIPEVLVQAVLAAEDADFYSHEGLDYMGMARALYNSLRAGRVTGSGSTITQQTVKNMLLTHERSFTRKAREIILTRRLEERLSKDDILTIYLNTIYLGHGRYGVEEAARYYFDKHAAQLDLNEAATLAGIIQSPERLSPRKHATAAVGRRAYVLEQMAKNGFITAEAASAVDHSPIVLAEEPPERIDTAMWFVNVVKRQVLAKLGEDALYEGGLRIYTTLDLRRQRAAQAAVRRGLLAIDARQGFGEASQHIKDSTPWREKRKRALAAWQQDEPDRKDKVPLERAMPARVQEITRDTIHVDLGFVKADIPRENAQRFANDKGQLPFRPGDEVVVSLRADGPAYPKKMDAVLAGAPQSAMVVMDPRNRAVLALVGGWDYASYPYDRATQARRQPGSSFKPFVYGAALASKRFTPATVMLDAPETWQIGPGKWWKPKNYDGKYRGEVSLRTALARSINTVAVKLTNDLGIEPVQTFARQAGIRSELADNLTLALGSSEVSPLELVNAYATIANGGLPGEPYFITEVADAQGVIDVKFGDDTEDRPDRAIDEDVAWLLRNMMRSVVTAGSGIQVSKLTKREVVGKTGTSNDARDTWFVGLLPEVVAAAWVGFDAPQSLGPKETGGRTAAPIVGEYLKEVEGRGADWAPPPKGISKRLIDPSSGLLAAEDRKPNYTEFFLDGTEPTEMAAAADAVNANQFMMNQFDPLPEEDDEDRPNAAPLAPLRPVNPGVAPVAPAPIKPAMAAPAPIKPARAVPALAVPKVPVAAVPDRLGPGADDLPDDDEDQPE